MRKPVKVHSPRRGLIHGEKARPEPAQANLGYPPGSRVRVTPAAGSRLAGKTGTVIGGGYYPKSVRLALDGSKVRITLHADYLAPIDKDIGPTESD